MEILVRASVVYWFLWLVVRGTGKRSLSQMSPLDILLVVGSVTSCNRASPRKTCR